MGVNVMNLFEVEVGGVMLGLLSGWRALHCKRGKVRVSLKIFLRPPCQKFRDTAAS